ncbi:putative DNA topoisomerase (ATP-hydrolyzing) [Medicago truncatula]|uniref:Putative DNA topoisomerase (ATP-hydrolyzing) n=1 Tax=Medicago truncatula TaxID=3880 RepID=A0A396HX58_MEDTR|nr:putative DNA topoisomerase (ATP-hydrolyzing) [Medicago truncatula]
MLFGCYIFFIFHSVFKCVQLIRPMDQICFYYRLVMGWIRFVEGKKIFDCINSPNTAHPTPVYVEEIKVFRILANDHFCNANHCIVISVSNFMKTLASFDSILLCINSIFSKGRGYPDIPTRRCEKSRPLSLDIMLPILCILYFNRFLRLLVDNLYIPAYCLVDCDPYGFDILTTYRFGSMQMAYDTKHLRVPEIHWLGAFPSDSDRYFVPKQCLLPLTVEDKRKIKAMLLRCYLQREVPEWRLELRMMLQKGVKFEIEALSVHTLSFLTESYIPSKIHGKVKI